MEIKHKFQSAKADGPDSTLVQPGDWNDDHDVIATSGGTVIGRTAAGPGPMTEIPMGAILPTGVVLPYAAIAAPVGTGWLLSYGQLLNRITYATLFAAIGTTYGPGDGATTFAAPDMRGVVPVGKSNMGGSDRGNMPGGGVLGAYLGTAVSPAVGVSVGVSGGIAGSTFGSIGVTASGQTGGPDNTLSRGDQGGGTPVASQSHTHSVTVTGSTSGSLGVTGSFSGAGTGATGTFSIVQPSLVMNYIINTGV